MDMSYFTQVVGSLGVIASILYLAMQIRQNTKISRSETMHGLTTRLTERLLLVATNNELAGLIAKSWDEDELSKSEKHQLVYWISAIIIDLKDIHTQVQLNIIPKSFLMERTQVMKQGIFNSKLGKEIWCNVKQACDVKFITWFETQMSLTD